MCETQDQAITKEPGKTTMPTYKNQDSQGSYEEDNSKLFSIQFNNEEDKQKDLHTVKDQNPIVQAFTVVSGNITGSTTEVKYSKLYWLSFTTQGRAPYCS